MKQLIAGLTVVVASMSVWVGACCKCGGGDSSSSSTTPSAEHTTAAAPTAAAFVEPTDRPTLRMMVLVTENPKKCPEATTYIDCILGACKTTFSKCYGEKAMEGQFTGPCKEVLECDKKCQSGSDMMMAKCMKDCEKHKEEADCKKCLDDEKESECMHTESCHPPTCPGFTR